MKQFFSSTISTSCKNFCKIWHYDAMIYRLHNHSRTSINNLNFVHMHRYQFYTTVSMIEHIIIADYVKMSDFIHAWSRHCLIRIPWSSHCCSVYIVAILYQFQTERNAFFFFWNRKTMAVGVAVVSK